MPKPIPLKICIACSRAVPSGEYARNSMICHYCAALTPNEVAILTKGSVEALARYATKTREGRKAAHRDAKLAEYAIHGKRCTACHGRRPPAAYNRNLAMGDGLQQICRACDEIRRASLKTGGRPQWHLVRDALRAANDGKPT